MNRLRADDTILIVEDDMAMGSLLERLVLNMGFRTSLVLTGEDAVILVTSKEPAAIVLDVRLPGMDGCEVARELRRSAVRSAIVMVTVATNAEEEIAGLDAGADDYIAKPFHNDVLRARLLAAIRHRRSAGVVPRLEYADVSLDLVSRRAEAHGHALSLSPLEFQLLRLFLERAEEVVTRSDLAASAWGDCPDLNTKKYHAGIHRLRERLSAARCRVAIETVHGRGYVLTRARSSLRHSDVDGSGESPA
jgi:DNA-binding response OmpR family regulator